MAKAKEQQTVKYVLTLTNGDTRVLTVPRSYRITYGAGARNPGERSQFRVYDGTKLIVVWRDVNHITLDGLDIKNGVSVKRVMDKMAGKKPWLDDVVGIYAEESNIAPVLTAESEGQLADPTT